jgi:hypothetical protein
MDNPIWLVSGSRTFCLRLSFFYILLLVPHLTGFSIFDSFFVLGKGSIDHLKILMDDAKTHDEYAHLWNETSNSWAERSDVYAKFDDHVGKLTVGFGAPGHFGTELEFGWYVCF